MEMDNRPLSIRFEETKMAIAKICNESGLPAFGLAYLLSDLAKEAESLIKKQYENDLEIWKMHNENESDS